MLLYKCKPCNFESDRLADFSRHTKTTKHLKNINSLDDKKNNEDRYICDKCGADFAHYTNMRRHRSYRCKEKFTNNSEKVTELKKQVNDKDNQIDLMNKMMQNIITSNKEQMDKLINILNINAETIKTSTEATKKSIEVTGKSISTFSYIVKNFKNNPPLKQLNYSDITRMLSYDNFTNNDKSTNIKKYSPEIVMIIRYKIGILHEYLGDIIIKTFKNNNPELQSMWTTDVARLSFTISQIIGNNKTTEWIKDKGGIKITSYIITPLLENVRDILITFTNDNYDIINEKVDSNDSPLDNEEVQNILEKMNTAREIIVAINKQSIHKQILKYIAPHFGLSFQ